MEGVIVVKTSTTSAYGAAGQTLNYNYAVTNTGPDTLTGITVNDNLIPSVSCPSSSLAGGTNETCTGSYVTTQADVDRGYVTNTATVSATTPTNENRDIGTVLGDRLCLGRNVEPVTVKSTTTLCLWGSRPDTSTTTTWSLTPVPRRRTTSASPTTWSRA